MSPITLPVAQLRPALPGFGKVIAKKSSLPVLGCILVQRQPSGAIQLTATDLDHYATFRLGTQPRAEPLDLLVPLEDLNNVVKSCGSAESIRLDRTTPTTTTIGFPIADQPGEHHCQVPPVQEFPEVPGYATKAAMLPPPARRAIVEALECASTDATRLVLNGAFIDVSDPESHHIVGTDGKHLFAANSFALKLRDSLLIPTHKFLQWKGLQLDGDWFIHEPAPDQQWFKIATNHWHFVARMIDGRYPDWRTVLPLDSAFTSSISLHAHSIDRVMQAVVQLPTSDERSQMVGIEATPDGLCLLGQSHVTAPWTKIAVPNTRTTGTPNTVFVDRRLLLKALRFGFTQIEVIDQISPIRFSQAGRQMIVMPMRPAMPHSTTEQEAAAPDSEPPPTPVSPTEAMAPPTPPMQTTNHQHNGGNGSTAAAPTMAEEPKPALDSALEQLDAIKTRLRDTGNSLARLSDTIRQAQRDQKASNREVQNVRQTLRTLQGVRL